jgi:ABC-2 type transport system permease protein
MYEFRMIEEINNGTINSVITRPMSFFEYYFSQFMGYKIFTLLISIVVPLFVCWALKLPLNYARLPGALALVIYYLVFLYLISFIVSTVSFHLNRIYGLTMAKNLALWVISGELVPLDIFPEPYRTTLMNLPFANGVFTPTAYLTGRIDFAALYNGFLSVTAGIIVCTIIAVFAWKNGMKQYTGTGA